MRTSIFFPAIAALLLWGCGGVADCRAIHELNVHVSRHGHPIPRRSITVAMRVQDKAPFLKAKEVEIGPAGQAHAAFESMWGAAFLVIPPLGLVPPHPPKPAYMVTIGGRQVLISPDTPGVTYRWDHGSWQTDASIVIP